MVQLNLLDREDAMTVAGVVATLAARSAARLGDRTHPYEAARITERRFGSWAFRSLDNVERARVSAYYRAVLRRRVLRIDDPGAATARRRLVAASIEADLLEAGWAPLRAAEEARRVIGEAVRYGSVA